MSLLRSPFSLYGLDLIPLERTAMGIGLSGSAFPSWQRRALCLKDLGDVPLILYRRWEKIILEECRKEKYSPDIYCVSDDARTCREWAEAGLGAAVAPMTALRKSRELILRTLQEEALSSDLYLARRKEETGAQSALLFFRMAEKYAAMIPRESKD